jgi:hypothetical protein
MVEYHGLAPNRKMHGSASLGELIQHGRPPRTAWKSCSEQVGDLDFTQTPKRDTEYDSPPQDNAKSS